MIALYWISIFNVKQFLLKFSLMRILIVDDETKIADALSERLSLRGFDPTPVYDGGAALQRLQKETFDAVLLDLRLPDIDGSEVLKQALEWFPGLRVVILSGHASEQEFKSLLRQGASACFQKPAKIQELVEALSGGREDLG